MSGGIKALLFGVTVAAVCVWMYLDYRERQPISTTEWRERMRKLNF